MRDERAVEHVALVPEEKRFKSFHVITPEGQGLSTGAAAVATMASLRRTTRLGRALAALRLVWLVGAVYHVIAKSKRVLARLTKDGPGPDRYP